MKAYAKSFKKILAAVLTVIMVFSCFIMAVSAEDPLTLKVELTADKDAKTITAAVEAPEGYEINSDTIAFTVSPNADKTLTTNNGCIFYNLKYGTKYVVDVTCEVTKNGGSITKSAAGKNEKTLEKKDGPAAPEGLMVEAITDDSITVTKIDNAIYSLNNGEYTSDNEFKGLSNGQTYTISAKYAETDDTKESDIVTCKATLDSFVKVADYNDRGLAFYAISNNTGKTITVYPVMGEIEEISVVPTALKNEQPDGSFLLYNLNADTDYVITANGDSSATITMSIVDLTRTAPANFKVISGTKDSVKVSEYTDKAVEYTIDNWATKQDSNEFTGLTAGTEYTIKVRYKATETKPESYDAEVTYKPLASQEAPKASDIKVESRTEDSITLTAIKGAEYSILNGAEWQDDPTFSGLTAGTEYTFQVRMKATETANASDAVQVKGTPKAVQSAPADFAVTALTKTSVTVTSYAAGGVQYSRDNNEKDPDKKVWQDSNTFSGLSTGAEYTIYARYKETDTKQASEMVSVKVVPSEISLVVKTAEIKNGSGYINITVTYDENYELTGVTLKKADSDTVIEPANDPVDEAKDGVTSAIFVNLEIGVAYEVSATAHKNDGDTKATINVEIKKKDCELVPTGFKVEAITEDSVTLTKIDGVEYSKDGTNYVESNEFKGLETGKEYTFYARYAETADTNAGEAVSVKATPKKAMDKPTTPVLVSKTKDTITIKEIKGAEYFINIKGDTHPDTGWTTSTKFTGLAEETEYEIFARYPETATTQKSEESTALVVKTLKASANQVPPAPTFQNVTEHRIVINEINGCEYMLYKEGEESKGVWKTTNEYQNLEAGTWYCAKMRIPVDETVQEPNPESKVSRIKTNTAAPYIIDESKLEDFTLTTDNGKFTVEAKAVKKATTDEQWGDIRFIPAKYQVVKDGAIVLEGSFTTSDAKTYKAEGSVSASGDYTISVVYNKQRFNGTAYETISNPAQSKTFTVKNIILYYIGKFFTFIGTTIPQLIMKFFDWFRSSDIKIPTTTTTAL